MTSHDFVTQERLRAAAWKASTDTLPDEARAPSVYIRAGGLPIVEKYNHCLPPEYAPYTLLPDIREGALALFGELGIPWHAAIGGGPGNHLLSSQVQCVNALGRMVTDADQVVAAFGSVVDIAEVLEVEPGRFLTFEFIGDTDYFGESPSGPRTRGAHCTSVDAAFMVRTSAPAVELVLVEWKYTESYRRRDPDTVRDAIRRRRYGAAWSASDGPVRSDLVDLNVVLAEPFYQLVRQQLLAHAIERDPRRLVDAVRIVHVRPAENTGYQTSVHDEELLALGATVDEIWSRLLRSTDRYVALDSAAFLNPAITSDEYVARYG